jgi:hypothetical protein
LRLRWAGSESEMVRRATGASNFLFSLAVNNMKGHFSPFRGIHLDDGDSHGYFHFLMYNAHNHKIKMSTATFSQHLATAQD